MFQLPDQQAPSFVFVGATQATDMTRKCRASARVLTREDGVAVCVHGVGDLLFTAKQALELCRLVRTAVGDRGFRRFPDDD